MDVLTILGEILCVRSMNPNYVPCAHHVPMENGIHKEPVLYRYRSVEVCSQKFILELINFKRVSLIDVHARSN
jgi:hypothetical protein